MNGALAGMFAGAFIGATAFLLLGLVASAVIYLASQAAPYPAPGFALALVALSMGIGALAGAIIALLARLFDRPGASAGPRPLRDRRWFVPVVAAAVSLPWSLFVADRLFAGRRAQQISSRLLWQVLLVLVAALTLWAFLRLALWVRARGEQGRPPRLLGLVSLAVAAALLVVDLRVLVRLYPFFHVSLQMAAAACALLGAFALHPPSWLRRPLLVAALGGGLVALAFIATFEEFRAAVARASFMTPLAQLGRGGDLDGMARATSVIERGALVRDAIPGGGIRAAGRDVVLVTVDALRADRLGCYGYRRPTPNFDAFAAQSVIFDRAQAPTPHTSFSIASLLTGRHAYARLTMGGYQKTETLPETLRAFRLKTGAFFPPAVFFIDRERFLDHEQDAYGFEYVKYEFLPAQRRIDQIRDFVRNDAAGRQMFLWVHYFEPHEPYEPHAEFDFGQSASDRYDGEVALVDAAFGALLELLDAERPGAIVIVTADHGEEFGEHGGYYHGTTLYEEQIRVPWLIRIPGVPPGHVRPAVSTIDIAPTVLSLLDIPIPSWMDGVDQTPALGGRSFANLVISAVDRKRAATVGAEKLLCDFETNGCELYDLASDPAERVNLVDRRSARVTALRRDLIAGLARFSNAMGADASTPSAAAQQRQVIAERARLGDGEAIAALVKSIGEGDSERARAAADNLFDVAANHDLAGFALPKVSEVGLAHRVALISARLGNAAAMEEAAALLGRDDAPPDLRFRAALALGENGDARGFATLADKIKNGTEFEERRAAVRAIAHLAGEGTRAVLRHAVDDIRLRADVVEAFRRMKDPRTVPDLARLLAADRYVSVRVAAARALGELGERGRGPAGAAVRVLEQSLKRESEPAVRVVVEQSLAKLGRNPIK